MKLVEILARDLGTWPSDLVLVQGAGGSVYEAGGGDFIGFYDLSEDWRLAEVTRPQWQAERDRMKAMEKIEQGIKQFENDADAFKRNVGAMAFTADPTYEQQLWDRAYADAWRHGFSVLGSDCSTEYFQSMTQASARMADAFMAERAKRVGK